jgi:radical SAM superfamily enzyme YgiQ (UPF0313 family)
MVKVLLSTVMRPFGIDSDDCTARTQAELFHGQVTFAQGVFSLRATYGGFGLEFMAINLKAKTVVLNYPNESEFIKEIQKGYDYIGITFVMCTFNKMKKMSALVRKYAPEAKLILGGYGVTLPGTDDYADFVCREEGVTFMRRLLGEDINAPLRHPIIPEVKKLLGYPLDRGAVILAGLGCPNGCDFCCTSHFFQRRHLPILETGQDIWRVIQEIDKHLHTRLVGIMEEDFLMYKKRVMEFAEITRKEVRRPVRMLGFSSIRTIAQYDPVFLAEMGFESLWVGIESKSSQELRERKESKKAEIGGKEADISSYSKMDNIDIPKTLKALQDVGINALVSMIVGLDHHTDELIQKDLDFHLSLYPSLSQFMIYTAIPGTPLYECMNKEGRILHDMDWHLIDGFRPNYKHKNIAGDKLIEWQMECFKQDYEKLGPTVFRFINIALRGYRRFCDSDIPIQQARAKGFAKYCKQVRPLFDVGIKYAPNDMIVGKIQALQADVEELFGKAPLGQKILGKLAFTSARVGQQLIDENRWTNQPKLEKVVYNNGKFTSPRLRMYKLLIPHRYAKD